MLNHPQESFQKERITPEMALEILTHKNFKNRPIKKYALKRLTDAIKSGEWIVTNQGISFDPDGNLLDGQHRLHACIEANKPIDILVARNINPKAFQCVDIGASRTAGDTLDIINGNNSQGKLIAAAVKVIWYYDNRPAQNWNSADRPSNTLIADLYLKDRDIYDLAAQTVRSKGGKTNISSNSPTVAFYVLAHRRNWPIQKLDEFLDNIYVGANLPSNNVCLSFRNQLSTPAYKKRGNHQQRYILNAFIKAFNTWAENKPCIKFYAPLEKTNLYPILPFNSMKLYGLELVK
tara:strand:+ start:604 stop:1479 length:876 start_codon:yes stop_codon:yes gene_type:complete